MKKKDFVVTGETKKFSVQLDILPKMEFEGQHPQDAVQQYYQFFGILGTEQFPTVEEVN